MSLLNLYIDDLSQSENCAAWERVINSSPSTLQISLIASRRFTLYGF